MDQGATSNSTSTTTTSPIISSSPLTLLYLLSCGNNNNQTVKKRKRDQVVAKNIKKKFRMNSTCDDDAKVDQKKRDTVSHSKKKINDLGRIKKEINVIMVPLLDELFPKVLASLIIDYCM